MAAPIKPFRPTDNPERNRLQKQVEQLSRITTLGSPSLGMLQTPAGPAFFDPSVDFDPCVAVVRNDTGDDLDRGAILHLDEPLFLPQEDRLDYLARISFKGDAPANTDDRVCILIEPTPANGVGRAVVTGFVPTSVYVTDTSHGFASPAEPALAGYFGTVVPVGGTDTLNSATTGAAEIVWKAGAAVAPVVDANGDPVLDADGDPALANDGGLGVKDAVVRLLAGGGQGIRRSAVVVTSFDRNGCVATDTVINYLGW